MLFSFRMLRAWLQQAGNLLAPLLIFLRLNFKLYWAGSVQFFGPITNLLPFNSKYTLSICWENGLKAKHFSFTASTMLNQQRALEGHWRRKDVYWYLNMGLFGGTGVQQQTQSAHFFNNLKALAWVQWSPRYSPPNANSSALQASHQQLPDFCLLMYPAVLNWASEGCFLH